MRGYPGFRGRCGIRGGLAGGGGAGREAHAVLLVQGFRWCQQGRASARHIVGVVIYSPWVRFQIVYQAGDPCKAR